MKRALFFLTLFFFSLHGFAQNAAEAVLRGNQFYQQGQFDQAEVHYRQALEYDPANEKARYNLANALQKQDKYEEAAKLLEGLATATKDKPLKASAYYNQGVAYSKLKNLEASIESYKKSLRLNPADQEARENLEKALLELKKKQQQQKDQQKKPQSSMSQKEAEQKLKLLNQKEKELHQRKDKKQEGTGQAQDW
jgi:Ca-activated chloride channel family protein